MVQAALASLLVVALFLDVLSNRKQVWLIIGFAAGLSYLARKARAGSVQPDAVGPPDVPPPLIDG